MNTGALSCLLAQAKFAMVAKDSVPVLFFAATRLALSMWQA
jgi:hypothetical protein